MAEALQVARKQPVAYVALIGAPTGNADGGNPDGKRGWQWVMVTPVATVFLQGLSRSAAAAIDQGRLQDLIEAAKAHVRANAEHPFRVM